MGCWVSTTDKHDKSIGDEASSNSVDSLYNSEKVKQDASEALHAFELGVRREMVSPDLVDGVRASFGDLHSPQQYYKFTLSRKNQEAYVESSEIIQPGFELRIRDYDIGDDGVIALAEMLKQNCNIRMLSVVNDTATSLSAEHIGYGIKYNNRLSGLDLSGNVHLGTQGVHTLLKYMDDMCNSLMYLNLSNVGMDDEGCMAVANLLLADKVCLEHVNVADNSLVTEMAIKNFAVVLRAYHRLRKFEYMNSTIEVVVEENCAKAPDEVDGLIERNNLVMDVLDDIIDRSVEIGEGFAQASSPVGPKETDSYDKPSGIVVSERPLVLSPFDIETTPQSIVDSFGFAELCGNRKQMQDFTLVKPRFRGKQDEHLFGVFDGHGGVQCVRFIRANFAPVLQQELERCPENIKECLINTFEVLNTWCKKYKIPHGTCAVVCYIRGNLVHTACVGDSQTVLVQSPKDGPPSGKPLSTVMKPSDPSERARIEAQGGFVTSRGRVCGVLAVSRALGDAHIPCVSAVPMIASTELSLTTSSQMLVIASDGVWNVHTLDDVCSLIEGVSNAHLAAQMLCESAFNSGSNDNISVICIKTTCLPTEEVLTTM